MNTNIYRFDIKEHLDNFYTDIVSVSSHNYRIESIVAMIISTYKCDSSAEMHMIGRFCLHFGNDSPTDMHIMANSIKRLRINLIQMLDSFQLVHMRNEEKQFPYTIHFKSLTNEYLLIEVRFENHGSPSI